MAYHHPHQQAPPPYHHQAPPEPALQGQRVRIFCKADKTYNLAVRNHTPVMVPARSDDPSQLWIKDMTPANHTQDNYGSPAFILINEATGKVLKHGKQEGKQLSVVDFRPGHIDEDILFSESQDFGEGFRTIRMASDTLLNMTVFHEEEKKSLFHHGDKQPTVTEGALLVLDTWHKQDNQLWKIFPLSC
ncbi:hypothetical protein L7F22_015620 [Adiantum nelumboides]|nr:hypothetical protein [Adiantum nelumboides]